MRLRNRPHVSKGGKAEMKIALIQMKVQDQKSLNLKTAKKHIKEAARNGAELVILPEMFNTPYNNSYFEKFAEEYPGESTDVLKNLAKELNLVIVGGSIPEREDEHIYNTSYVFSKKGDLIAKHRKIHLFDIDVEGGAKFKESDTLTAGEDLTTFQVEDMKFGLIVCYDIRFPDLSMNLALKGVDAIIVPAAFNMTTGPAHWHLSARARALDNQVYTLLCSQSRNEDSSYKAYGHSLLASPWGNIQDELGTKEGILYSNLDKDYITKVRRELPLLKHRRPNIYEIK